MATIVYPFSRFGIIILKRIGNREILRSKKGNLPRTVA